MHPEKSSPAQQWFVIVDEAVNAYQGRRITATIPAGEDLSAARAAARDLAFRHRPIHPTHPRGRHVFEEADNSWLVLVRGVTRSWHFRVTVTLFLGEAHK